MLKCAVEKFLTNRFFHQETEKRGRFYGIEAVRVPERRDTQIIQHTHTHSVSLWKDSALLISDMFLRFTLLFEVGVSVLCLCVSGSLWRRISRSEVSRIRIITLKLVHPVPPPPVQPPPYPSSPVPPPPVHPLRT